VTGVQTCALPISGQPEVYEHYMHALINGWREVFNRPEIPVIYAQLPNFMDVSYVPSESNWAALRHSQLKALSIPNSAMTVNIDLGEWNDIQDRKSTRLNSSHVKSSYAVFCLKKKK